MKNLIDGLDEFDEESQALLGHLILQMTLFLLLRPPERMKREKKDMNIMQKFFRVKMVLRSMAAIRPMKGKSRLFFFFTKNLILKNQTFQETFTLPGWEIIL